MTLRVLAIAFLLCSAAATRPQNNDAGTSVSLAVKTSLYPSDTLDRYGHGIVRATFRYESGRPISGTQISLSSTCGELSCVLPDIEGGQDSVSSDQSCFTTGNDGSIRVYLIRIPFNSSGEVTASCAYGDYTVTARCSFWIKRVAVARRAASHRKPGRKR